MVGSEASNREGPGEEGAKERQGALRCAGETKVKDEDKEGKREK